MEKRTREVNISFLKIKFAKVHRLRFKRRIRITKLTENYRFCAEEPAGATIANGKYNVKQLH